MRHFEFGMLNKPIDVASDFFKYENTYFLANRVTAFCPKTGTGRLKWDRYHRKVRLAFGEVNAPFEKTAPWEFPPRAYVEDPELPFSLSFVTPRTIRLRIYTNNRRPKEDTSLMLVGDVPKDTSWQTESTEEGTTYRSSEAAVKIHYDPWRIDILDKTGSVVTSTQHFQDSKSLMNCDPIPWCFVRRNADLAKRVAASFTLTPQEKLFGCGESFTRLNKRGQRIVVMTNDAHGAHSSDMYKPIPFFMSSAGYGMFVHTSAPLTFDFGHSYDAANTIYTGDEHLDLFVFVGSPKEILGEYTALTGRSPLPPVWSFGLWMSRMTYESEKEVREVAAKLREHEIPCDVIHIDTGWFEEDWRCDYQFSESRFEDPEKMIADLRKKGFRISLWQLPYLTPGNRLYQEAIDKGYVVLGPKGEPPTEDAIIDFSNPQAVQWYQRLLRGLLEKGVAAIKVDFGEASPLNGLFASGKTGFYEHNLYPLRYNKAAFEASKQVYARPVIWARSAWAGSQRYPVHWGGDAENTDCGMAATLRAGLSMGLSGFAFWSHDIGGFVQRSPEKLYRRWTPFGLLSSHSRCHGAFPREPWNYSEDFMNTFRKSVSLKYRLMPYVYGQAATCSRDGLPMLRTLFLEFPEDRTAWFIEDQYMFGSNLLVAPLFEEAETRDVYLPKGTWLDYQTGRTYTGGMWHRITAGEVPCIILVRDGSVIPHIGLAQSTDQMNWKEIELFVFATQGQPANGAFCLPDEDKPQELRVLFTPTGPQLAEDPFKGDVKWTITVK